MSLCVQNQFHSIHNSILCAQNTHQVAIFLKSTMHCLPCNSHSPCTSREPANNNIASGWLDLFKKLKHNHENICQNSIVRYKCLWRKCIFILKVSDYYNTLKRTEFLVYHFWFGTPWIVIVLLLEMWKLQFSENIVNFLPRSDFFAVLNFWTRTENGPSPAKKRKVISRVTIIPGIDAIHITYSETVALKLKQIVSLINQNGRDYSNDKKIESEIRLRQSHRDCQGKLSAK